MNIPIEDWSTIVRVATFIPLIIAAVFVALCFHRAGYGWIGKLLVLGFGLLVLTLFLGLTLDIETLPPRLIVGGTWIAGWALIAAGFVIWYLELDRSLP